ncbi:MAG: sulfatase-like hydrolase/transferase [Phycisphaerales bacterium]|nr:sulfatase-like hydrolase/transferase [Phycisphaerales bacterium]
MTKQPNILFIMADDMGYGDFGVFSEGRCRTPALDRLVAEGVCLTQHYSAAPICTPARAGFLTGRYPHRTGGIDMREARGLDRIALRERTIADCFKYRGYKTGLVGKWHNGCIDPAHHPNARGFDEFFGFRHGGMYYNNWLLEKNGQCIRADGRYLTDVLTDAAVDFIDRHAGKPFFLDVAYNAPHEPLEVPEEEVAPYREANSFHENVCKVYAMVTRMDKGIARILETLERNGIADNTIVCFTSDNGPAMYDNMDRFTCNYRGGKGNVYEAGIRVPMLLRWPDGLPRNKHFDALAHYCDWLPTLLAAAGGTPRTELPIDGNNLLPALQGKENWLCPKRFWQWNRYRPVIESNAAMRDGPWKLVRPALHEANMSAREEVILDRKLWTQDIYQNPDVVDRSWEGRPFPPRALPPAHDWELYNLDCDPGENQNLAASHPDRVRSMARELETWFDSVERDRTSITGMPK